MKRLIKPTLWPHGISKKPLGPLNNPLNLTGPLRSSRLPTNHQRTHQMSLLILWNTLDVPLDPVRP